MVWQIIGIVALFFLMLGAFEISDAESTERRK